MGNDLILQVEDAKEFIKARILQLAEQRQAPNKVSAGTSPIPMESKHLCYIWSQMVYIGRAHQEVAGKSAGSVIFAG